VVVPNFSTGQQSNPVPIRQTSPILYAAFGGMTVLAVVLAGFLLYPRSSSDEAKKSEESSVKKSEETAKNNSTANVQQSYQSTNSQAAEKPMMTPPPAPSQPYISPAGNWQGQWTNGKGSAFGQQFTLKDDGNGKITGQVVHTLQQTINPQKAGKIGLTAVEYVQGTYDPNTRIITMSGIRKDDPNDLIILDKYRLSLSSDNSTIAGATVGGKTRGQITLRR
jgi:hypothetical protein